MGLSDIRSTDDVLKATDEYRRIGESAFLEKYHFADTYDYVIDFEDGEYPAKAILGAAHSYAKPEYGATGVHIIGRHRAGARRNRV